MVGRRSFLTRQQDTHLLNSNILKLPTLSAGKLHPVTHGYSLESVFENSTSPVRAHCQNPSLIPSCRVWCFCYCDCLKTAKTADCAPTLRTESATEMMKMRKHCLASLQENWHERKPCHRSEIGPTMFGVQTTCAEKLPLKLGSSHI